MCKKHLEEAETDENWGCIVCLNNVTFNNDDNDILKGELTKKFLFLFSLDQVSLISLLKYFPPKMSLT